MTHRRGFYSVDCGIAADLLDKVWPGYYQKITSMANQLNKDELIKISDLLLKLSSGLEGVAKRVRKN